MEQLMSLIDENSERIPEGDYLQMCRIMKEMYKTKNTLFVTPDVVSENFIMTSEALNKCHTWIRSTEALRESFIEHEKDPEDKVKLGIYKQIREASRSYWCELCRTYGYEELMWFVHRGTNAERDFRYYGTAHN
jgi:hypothetical protein|tara:strand:+ start:3563 stop:3964 length:402 start_codon:yes stop_codon:yes gene_type:complete